MVKVNVVFTPYLPLRMGMAAHSVKISGLRMTTMSNILSLSRSRFFKDERETKRKTRVMSEFYIVRV